MRRVRRPSPSPKAAAKRTNRGTSGSVGARVSNRHDVLHDEVDSGDSDNNEAAEHATFLAEQAEAEEAEVAESAEERRVRLAKEMIVAMDAASSERLTHQGSTDHIGRDSDIVTEALAPLPAWGVLDATSLRPLRSGVVVTQSSLRPSNITIRSCNVTPSKASGKCMTFTPLACMHSGVASSNVTPVNAERCCFDAMALYIYQSGEQ